MIDLKHIGVRIGHKTDTINGTGCSVFIFDKEVKASVSIRGSSPASHETELLKPGKLLQTINAITLTGGSAYGLEAASGVMAYLEENGIGYDTQVAVVPIVPSAAIYDLKYKNAIIRPTKQWGYEAAQNSTYTLKTGVNGAATGATIGKFLGMEHASKTAFGYSYMECELGYVAAFAIVNALGEIIDNQNNIVAGVRKANEIIPTHSIIEHLNTKYFNQSENTTLIVLITNYPLSKEMLYQMAEVGHNGIVRSIRPSHTPFDGDTVFAVSTSNNTAEYNPYKLLKLFVMTEAAAQKAILNSVTGNLSEKTTI